MTFNLVHSILILLILVLAVYIVFLHVKLARKDLVIEDIQRKISGIEKKFSLDEIRMAVNELETIRGKAMVTDDRLFDDNVLEFIMSDLDRSATYVHYTKDEKIAARIMNEGFMFAESFYRTAIRITGDRLELIIKHNSKKLYGDYIVVIGISDRIVKIYSDMLESEGITNYFLENILTETSPCRNDNSEDVYVLSSRFVKGYLNFRTGEIFQNQGYDPDYKSPAFESNIARLKELRNKTKQ